MFPGKTGGDSVPEDFRAELNVTATINLTYTGGNRDVICIRYKSSAPAAIVPHS